MQARLGMLVACVAAVAASMIGITGAAAPTAAPDTAAVQTPEQDPFYQYTGSTPLSEITPGTVLKTRTVLAHVEGLPLPVRTVQLLYRTSDEAGQPTTTVTSVLEPPGRSSTSQLLSYQSFYDSLTPDCEPSYALSGGLDFGGISLLENPLMTGLLQQGYAIATSDFEGQTADFAAAHEYGMDTLDGIRAAINSPDTGLTPDTKVALMGYSGGAIATQWAAELAPEYAPDVNNRLVGAALGGLLVDPIHNLHYVDGTTTWSDIMPMALTGIARGAHADLTPYLSDYGQQIFNAIKDQCLTAVLGHYPNMTFASLVKPQYAQPESIPLLVKIANTQITGTDGTPTIPMLIRQGANGPLEGTPNDKPGIGPGDGVMIAGDVRTLAREYCSRGTTIDYQEYPLLSHTGTAVPWLTDTVPWITQRFAGTTATGNCSDIAPGNPIDPIPQS